MSPVSLPSPSSKQLWFSMPFCQVKASNFEMCKKLPEDERIGSFVGQLDLNSQFTTKLFNAKCPLELRDVMVIPQELIGGVCLSLKDPSPEGKGNLPSVMLHQSDNVCKLSDVPLSEQNKSSDVLSQQNNQSSIALPPTFLQQATLAATIVMSMVIVHDLAIRILQCVKSMTKISEGLQKGLHSGKSKNWQKSYQQWKDDFKLPKIGAVLVLEGSIRSGIRWIRWNQRPEALKTVRDNVLGLPALLQKAEKVLTQESTFVQKIKKTDSLITLRDLIYARRKELKKLEKKLIEYNERNLEQPYAEALLNRQQRIRAELDSLFVKEELFSWDESINDLD